MSGLSFDPVKVQKFNEGMKKHQEQNIKDSKTLLKTTGIGAAVGAVGGFAGIGIGAAVGFTVGMGSIIYDRLTEKGFKGGR